MAGKIAPVSCPKCGGQMWNNIEGKRNPKAPDYACKDKQGCGAGVWLKDAEKAALASVSPPVKQNGASPRPPVVLDKMMRACVKAAQAIASESFKDGDRVGLDDQLTLNMATTLYISRCRGEGILEVEKKALADLAAKAEAERIERERKEAEERARQSRIPQNYDDEVPIGFPPDDDSLPF